MFQRVSLFQLYSTNILEICEKLSEIPDVVLRKHFDNILHSVRQTAERKNIKELKDWLNHKDANPWILECISLAATGISKEDWRATSMDTNIAESAHALSQRHGIRLSLLSAIQKVYDLDGMQFGHERAAVNFGVKKRYGNRSITGRIKQSIKRSEKVSKKREREKAEEIVGTELAIVETLINKHGIDRGIIEKYLKGQTPKN